MGEIKDVVCLVWERDVFVEKNVRFQI